ncbi:MAG TPA: phage holin family protein [Tepidisphaeraceae bacterium]|jgi:hypothetical protein|nr:phage holin family protein [Tepidisphaeraceae bacterium]
MADSSPFERERTDLRGGAAGRTERFDTDTTRGNPDILRDGAGAESRSIGTLLKELRDESATLMRQEIALAKTEMSEKASRAGKNTASIAVGGAIAYAGAMVLLYGVAIALYFGLVALDLNHFLAGIIAFLVVGGVTAFIGYMLMQKGINALKNESVVPEKTVESLKEDKQWLTNQTK